MLPICTYSDPTSVSVGVTSAAAVAANSRREGLILTSLRTNTGQIALSFNSAAAVVNTGVILYPGEAFLMDERSYTTSAIKAISDVAAQTLSIQEM